MTDGREFVLGLTGASGAAYGVRMLQALYASGHRIHLLLTTASWQVLRTELDWPLEKGQYQQFLDFAGVGPDRVRWYEEDDFSAPVASGSYPTDGMVIIPCSMGTLSALAHGASDNLLERAADTMIKEGRPLVVVPRETPLHRIHLRNMLQLAEAGVKILPAMPGFYHRPATIADLVDFVVGKALDALHVEHRLYRRWGAEENDLR